VVLARRVLGEGDGAQQFLPEADVARGRSGRALEDYHAFLFERARAAARGELAPRRRD
jgi:hypothetical protein